MSDHRPRLPFTPPPPDPPELRALLRAGAWLRVSWRWLSARPSRLQALILVLATCALFVLVGLSERGAEQSSSQRQQAATPRSLDSAQARPAAELLDRVRLQLSGARVLVIRSERPRATARVGGGRLVMQTASGTNIGIDENGVSWQDGGRCWRRGGSASPVGVTQLLSVLYASSTRYAQPEDDGDGQKVSYQAEEFGRFGAGSGELRVDGEGRLTALRFVEQRSGQEQRFTVSWPGPATPMPEFQPVC